MHPLPAFPTGQIRRSDSYPLIFARAVASEKVVFFSGFGVVDATDLKGGRGGMFRPAGR